MDWEAMERHWSEGADGIRWLDGVLIRAQEYPNTLGRSQVPPTTA